MGRKRQQPIPGAFVSTINECGDRGAEIRVIVEGKQQTEHRKTYADTIVAIILEYGAIKKQQKQVK